MRRSAVLLALAAAATVSWLGGADAANNNCSRNTNVSDQVICSTPKLSAADDEMNRLYGGIRTKLQAQNRDTNPLAVEQNRWLAMRTACQGNVQCLTMWFQQRIPALNRMSVALTREAPAPARPQPGPSSPPQHANTDKPGSKDTVPQDDSKVTTGSGYAVTATGYYITNNHVVDGCKEVKIAVGEASGPAKVVTVNKKDDLALLKAELKTQGVATLRTSIRLGEEVAAFGFPLSGLLSSGGNFTLGNVTATTGMEDNPKLLQISAPVQPGNSGGPLVDQSGNVVGTVVSKLNALKLAKLTDDVTQNVNFAIKASVVADFLDAHKIEYQTGQPGEMLSPADLADRARSFAIYIECK